MNAVELDNIRYRFPDTALDALAAVDWQVEPGTLSLVTGQSGSG
jgi:energy-coupling factor transporter ATP-binding protein EcfA2